MCFPFDVNAIERNEAGGRYPFLNHRLAFTPFDVQMSNIREPLMLLTLRLKKGGSNDADEAQPLAAVDGGAAAGASGVQDITLEFTQAELDSFLSQLTEVHSCLQQFKA